MPKVAILSGAHPENRSGLQVVAMTHGRALKKRGWDVSFFFPSDSDSIFEYEGMQLYSFKRPLIKSAIDFVQFVRRARKMWRKTYIQMPDVIHGHDYLSFFAVAPMAVAETQTVFTVHDPLEYHQRMLGNLRGMISPKTQLIRGIESRVYGMAKAIHVISEYTRKRLRPRVGARAKLVSNWVDLNRFTLSAERSALRESMGIGPRTFVVFTARALEPRMGLDSLIRAIASVQQRIPSCQLVLAGDGPLRSTLSNLAAESGDNIRLLGFIPNEHLVQWYQASDLVVIPSIDGEGFGLPILEAMACGTPVIGTPIGAIPEVLSRLPHRVLAGTSDNAIAEGISQFVAHERGLVNPLTERAYVQEYYSEKQGVDLILEDYQGGNKR